MPISLHGPDFASEVVLSSKYRHNNRGQLLTRVVLPLPGAVVTVTQVAQNLSKTLTTNGYGIYEVKFLPIGPYKVTAEHAGFKKAVQEGLDLNVGQSDAHRL